jgi:hypothetical protein
MMSADDSLPDDVETLRRLLRARDAELAQVRAQASSTEALIAHLRLAIEKMRREIYGPRSERKARLIDQMELELEELEAVRRRFAPSRAESPPASHSRRIYRASASSSRGRPPAPAAAPSGSPSSART